MRPQVALPTIMVALLLVLAGCGGSSPSAQDLIRDTFANDAQVKSGRIGLGLDAKLKTGEVQATVDARFAEGASSGLPKLDGTLTLVSGGQTIKAGAISTGDRGWITVAGQAFTVPAADWKQFTDGYVADQKATDQRRASQPTLSALGVHPQQWLIDPRKDGDGDVDGTKTIHLTAGVDVPKMLADVAKIGKQANASDQVTALGAQVKSASVEVDTGADDHRLRRLVVHLKLSNGTVDLRVSYGDLDEPQTIAAPKDARPLSDLTAALSGDGSDAGAGEAAPSGGNDQRYLDCGQAAGSDVAKLQTCSKYL